MRSQWRKTKTNKSRVPGPVCFAAGRSFFHKVNTMKRKSKPKERFTKDQRVALHEAGHATMAWIRQTRIGWVSINPADFQTNENCLGMCCHPINRKFFEDVELDRSDATLHKIEVQLQITLAGVVTEAIWTGRHDWVGAQSDLETCNELWFRWWEGSEDVWVAHRKYLLAKVRDELSRARNRQLVKVLADALVQRRRLSGKQVRAVICDEFQRQYDEHRERIAAAKKP